MKVRMLTTISGTRNGEPWPAAGEVVDVPDDEGRSLVEANIAIEAASVREAAEPTDEREAVPLPTERAVAPSAEVRKPQPPKVRR